MRADLHSKYWYMQFKGLAICQYSHVYLVRKVGPYFNAAVISTTCGYFSDLKMHFCLSGIFMQGKVQQDGSCILTS